jgi:hypothetical protein
MYWEDLPRPHTRNDRLRLWCNLWIPGAGDPFLTLIAKIGFLFVLAWLFWSDMHPVQISMLSPIAEQRFVTHTIWAFIAMWILAATAALIMRRIVSRFLIRRKGTDQ